MLNKLLVILLLAAAAFAQESLNNSDIVDLTSAGLSDDLIVKKIRGSLGAFDVSTKGLIELKKNGVSDRVIKAIMDSAAKAAGSAKGFSDSTSAAFSKKPVRRVVLDKSEALKNARTVAVKKSSLHPSRQALEKELLKRDDWKKLNLTLVRHKDDADLYIEIGYVSMSWITHRYVYRIYENKSGTVVAAGETTSWGSLAKNLARGISKRLTKAMASAK